MTLDDLDMVENLLEFFHEYPTFTKTKRKILDLAISYMKKGRHVIFRTTYRHYPAGTVGRYFFYGKNQKRRGNLYQLKGKYIMVLCIKNPCIKYTEYIAAEVEMVRTKKKLEDWTFDEVPSSMSDFVDR